MATDPFTGRAMPGPDLDNLAPRLRELHGQFAKLFPEMAPSSGFRSPEHNHRVGGARGSEHTKGSALDYTFGKDTTPERQAEALKWWSGQGAGGLGAYKNGSFHVDLGAPGRAWGPNRSHTSIGELPEHLQSVLHAHRGGAAMDKGSAPIATRIAEAPPLPPARGDGGPAQMPTLAQASGAGGGPAPLIQQFHRNMTEETTDPRRLAIRGMMGKLMADPDMQEALRLASSASSGPHGGAETNVGQAPAPPSRPADLTVGPSQTAAAGPTEQQEQATRSIMGSLFEPDTYGGFDPGRELSLNA